MGVYVSSTELVAYIGTARAAQLSAESGTVPDTTVIDQRIDAAEGLANYYLSTKTTVPISQSTAPISFNMVKGWVLDMARYHLATRRDPVPEDWKSAHDEALAALQGVAKGEGILPDLAIAGTIAEYGASDVAGGREKMN